MSYWPQDAIVHEYFTPHNDCVENPFPGILTVLLGIKPLDVGNEYKWIIIGGEDVPIS